MNPAAKPCELCELAPTTARFAEHQDPFPYVILDCDSCDVPMVVFGAHTAAPEEAQRAIMQAALAQIATAKFGADWFFDDHMRQIPDHYHCHARPLPRWLPRRARE